MPHQFSEHEREPETQASASLIMGPPRKGIGIDVLDGPGETRLPVFNWPRISLLAGILLVIAGLAFLWFISFLHR